jgi:hypothetical protein
VDNTQPDLARCPEEWSSIGGSDIAALMVSPEAPTGLSPYSTHTDVYLRLGWGIGAEENEAMRIGKRAEPWIAQMIADRIASEEPHHAVRLIPSGGETARTLVWDRTPIRSQRDALITIEPAFVGVECKWTSRHNAPWSLDPEVCPPHYVAQANWAMGLRGEKHWIVGMAWGFDDDEMIVWRLQFDAALYAYQVAVADKFWLDHFVPDDDGALHPWAPVDPAAHAALAKAMWPRVTEPVIVPVTDDEAELVVAAAEAHEAKALAEKAWTPFKDTLTAMIRAREGVTANGVVWTYTGSKKNPEKRTLRRKEHADG